MDESNDYDTLLFSRPDGKPMSFCLLPDSCQQSDEYRLELVEKVKERGGLLLDHVHERYSDHIILLLGKNERPDKKKEMFDYRYLLDCMKRNQILDNMLDYRVSKSSLYQQYDEYEPLDVLHGYKTWSDIPLRNEGDRVSDIDDDFETSSMISMVSRVRSRASSLKSFKSPYTRRDREEIVRALVRFTAYRLVRGNTIWKKLESIGICNGTRTWQSMKEHFRKKVIYDIHTFGLSWRQVRRFRATYGLDEERDSDVESGEEEGVDSEERAFKPRRTSSPVRPVTEVLADTSRSEIGPTPEASPGGQRRGEKQSEVEKRKKKLDLMRQQSSPSTEPSPGPSKEAETSTIQTRDVRSDTSQSGIGPTLEAGHDGQKDKKQSRRSLAPAEAPSPAPSNREPSPPAEPSPGPSKEAETSTIQYEESERPKRSGKRKRKLFSNNNSYLDDDTNSNHVETPKLISPSKKRRVLSTLDETQEEELVSAQKTTPMDIDAGKIPEVIMNDAIIDQHQDTLEEVFGPDASPLILPPARRKSKISSPPQSPEPGSSRTAAPSSTETIERRESGQEWLTRRDSVVRKEGSPSGSTSSDTNKENLSRDYWYQNKRRSPFSRGEEETIVKYFLKKGGYSSRGGNTFWKQMEEDWVCPGRTWHSLKERFDKHIDPKLQQFGVSRQQLLDRDKELNRNKKNFGETKRETKRSYTKQEDLKIIQFICDNKRFADVKGNEVWKVMEERKVVEGRTWQSLKERFRKNILKNIKNYSLESEVLAMFSTK